MYICCCKTSTTASNSHTGRPRWITTWAILPMTMLLHISPLKVASPSVGVCVRVQTNAWKWSRILAKLSGQYWALFTVRKLNTSKINSSFGSPRPVKQAHLRVSPAFYFMTAERMAEISRNALLYQVCVAKPQISRSDILKRKGNLIWNKISSVNLRWDLGASLQ